MNDVIRAAP